MKKSDPMPKDTGTGQKESPRFGIGTDVECCFSDARGQVSPEFGGATAPLGKDAADKDERWRRQRDTCAAAEFVENMMIEGIVSPEEAVFFVQATAAATAARERQEAADSCADGVGGAGAGQSTCVKESGLCMLPQDAAAAVEADVDQQMAAQECANEAHSVPRRVENLQTHVEALEVPACTLQAQESKMHEPEVQEEEDREEEDKEEEGEEDALGGEGMLGEERASACLAGPAAKADARGDDVDDAPALSSRGLGFTGTEKDLTLMTKYCSEELINALRAHEALTKLTLKESCFVPVRLSAVLTAVLGTTTAVLRPVPWGYELPPRTPLTELCLDSISGFAPEVAVALAAELRENSSLTMLSINEVDSIEDGDVAVIADALRGNTTLKSLILTSNINLDAGAVAIADCIRANTCLTSLDIRANNTIADGGVMQIARALGVNTTLTVRSLRALPRSRHRTATDSPPPPSFAGSDCGTVSRPQRDGAALQRF